MASTLLQARMDEDLKARMDDTSAAIGITSSAAVNIFARQFVAFGGFPFPVEDPRKVTWEREMAALYEEAKAGKGSYHELLD